MSTPIKVALIGLFGVLIGVFGTLAVNGLLCHPFGSWIDFGCEYNEPYQKNRGTTVYLYHLTESKEEPKKLIAEVDTILSRAGFRTETSQEIKVFPTIKINHETREVDENNIPIGFEKGSATKDQALKARDILNDKYSSRPFFLIDSNGVGSVPGEIHLTIYFNHQAE